MWAPRKLPAWCLAILLIVVASLGSLSQGYLNITPVASQGTNVAPNPSFESGGTSPTGWLAWQEGDCPSGYKDLTWDKATGQNGSKSLKISVSPQTSPVPPSCAARWLSDFLPINPNMTYQFSATMKSTGNATGSLWVMAYNADGHFLTSRFLYADNASPDWFSVSAAVSALDGYFPSGTSQVRLALDIRPTSYAGWSGSGEPTFQGAAAVWFDEVFFGLPASPTPIFPTATPAPGGSAQQRALSRINYYRGLMGVPTVTEDSTLSQGAQNHAHYLFLNRFDPRAQSIRVHDEHPDLPGYTAEGVVAGPRSLIFTGSVTSWEDAIDGWMATPLHRLPLLNPRLTKVGLGHDWEPEMRQWEAYVLDPSIRDESQVSYYPVAFPAPGQRDVPSEFNGIEDPNPIPAGSPLPVGYPITLTFHPSAAVVVTSASLKDPAGNAIDTYSLFPNAPGNITVEYLWNSAILIPKSPLTPGTSYTVEIKYTSNASPFTKTWYFAVRSAAAPTPTPAPNPTTLPTAIPTPTATATKTPTATPVPATPTAIPSATPLATASPSPAIYPIEVALSSIRDSLILTYSYNPSTPASPWSIYDPKAPPFANTLKEVRTGQGLWVKVSEITVLAYNSFRYTLAPGWNVIGWRG